MKIEYLEIKNYKQFSNLELKLTYPIGHPKEGRPLDKICFIGQSGVGKTNILEIIKKSVIDFSKQEQSSYLPFTEFVGKETDDKYIISKFITKNGAKGEALFTDKKSKIVFDKQVMIEEYERNYFVDISAIVIDNKVFDKSKMSKTDNSILESLLKHRDYVINRGVSFYGLDKFSQKIEEIDRNIEDLENKYIQIETISDSLNRLKNKNFIDRHIINIHGNDNTSWKQLREKIESDERKKAEYKMKLFNKIIYDEKYSKEDSIRDMKKWEQENENILEKMAKDINSIIKKFNLELQINEYTQSYEELNIKDLANGYILKHDNLNSGTKNLLSTFIPLKSYSPKDSIILIDEPENSFYPDIQRELTDLYMSVGENNQLIMATHSPLIASSFEPWEVVELKFDKNNQIYRELYYEGENHIDNYTLDPRMLTWTGILTDIFDLKEDSNFIFREKKLMEYAMLKGKIKVISDIKEKEELFKKLQKIGKQLGLYNQ
jgi:predicted ATPase